MKGKIVGIESGSKFTDKEMRVTVRIVEADQCFNDIRVPVSVLGLSGLGTGPHLDQEMVVMLQDLPRGKK